MSSLPPRFKLLVDGQARFLEVTPGQTWDEWEQAITWVAQRHRLWEYRRHDTLNLQNDYKRTVHWAAPPGLPDLYLARESVHADLVSVPMPGQEPEPDPTPPPSTAKRPKPQQLSLFDLIGSPA